MFLCSQLLFHTNIREFHSLAQLPWALCSLLGFWRLQRCLRATEIHPCSEWGAGLRMLQTWGCFSSELRTRGYRRGAGKSSSQEQRETPTLTLICQPWGILGCKRSRTDWESGIENTQVKVNAWGVKNICCWFIYIYILIWPHTPNSKNISALLHWSGQNWSTQKMICGSGKSLKCKVLTWYRTLPAESDKNCRVMCEERSKLQSWISDFQGWGNWTEHTES